MIRKLEHERDKLSTQLEKVQEALKGLRDDQQLKALRVNHHRDLSPHNGRVVE